MTDDGFYREHSAATHVAASAFSYLTKAIDEIPLPRDGSFVIGDFGCGEGHNEIEPLRLAIEAVRARSDIPIEVVHTDVPSNDFSSLFTLVETSPRSYLNGQYNVFPYAAGRSLYGPVTPDERLSLGWTAIAVHWLSSMPGTVSDQVYPNLTTGAVRERLQQRSRADWLSFLRERTRELRSGGQLVVVGGASDADGSSGAEGLFAMIDAQLRAMVDEGSVRRSEYERIFYPVWNRTLSEYLAPFESGPVAEALDLVALREDDVDDADSYPQYVRDGDAMAFAGAYIERVRRVTEQSFFRWLEPDRSREKKKEIRDAFYLGLQARIIDDPATATCHWRTVSLRIIKRD